MKLSNIIFICMGIAASTMAAQQYLKPSEIPANSPMTAASLQDDLNRVQAMIDKAKQPTTAIISAKKSQMHKCVNAQNTIYTDESCPKGMQEQTIKNGTYNVISSVKVDAPKKEMQAGTMHDKALQQQLGEGY